VSDDMYERGVPGGALKVNSIGYPDHGRYGDLPLQGKIPTAEPGIEPGTSWLVARISDHQATRLVPSESFIFETPQWICMNFDIGGALEKLSFEFTFSS
jgi:hypothetical protein